jgi:hypothetical protein
MAAAAMLSRLRATTAPTTTSLATRNPSPMSAAARLTLRPWRFWGQQQQQEAE